MDRVANMLSTIKNTAMVGKKSIELPYTKMNEAVAKVLKEKGFLEEVKVFKEEGASHKMLHLDLKFEGGMPRISEVRRVSKPGRRVYKTASELRRVVGGYGIAVVSTSQGVLESMDARKRKLGGEVVCEVW